MNERTCRNEPPPGAPVEERRGPHISRALRRARAIRVGVVCILALAPTATVLADDTARQAYGSACRVTLADSLGDASPESHFSLSGSSGLGASANELIGPRIQLTHSVLITEIGALANNCKTFVDGVPDCPDARPLKVEIRPDEGGAPSLTKVIASFDLSHDDEPLEFSYESTAPSQVLPPGVYYVLFTAVGDDVGSLLQTASYPRIYRAEGLPFGVVRRAPPSAYTSPSEVAAVRVLGRLALRTEDLAGLDAQIGQLARAPQHTLRPLLQAVTRAVHFGNLRAARATLDALAWEVWQSWGKGIPEQAAIQILSETKRLVEATECSG